MINVLKLKEEARQHEHGNQWQKALDLYERIADESEGEDSGVWNRIGDLHVRLGQTERAVEAYERAVEAYVESGLHNNAIALCSKILRVSPARAPVYRRLGQISAAQGFFADARESFVQYAERVRQAGQGDDARAALREFVELSPPDSDAGLLLADQLEQDGRIDEAVAELQRLASVLQSRGRSADADAVRIRIRELDPAADADASSAAQGAAPDRAELGIAAIGDELALLPTYLGTPAAPPSAALGNELEDGLDLNIEFAAADQHVNEPAASADLLGQPSADGEPGEGESFLMEGLEPTQHELAWSAPVTDPGPGEVRDAVGDDPSVPELLPLFEEEFTLLGLDDGPASEDATEPAVVSPLAGFEATELDDFELMVDAADADADLDDAPPEPLPLLGFDAGFEPDADQNPETEGSDEETDGAPLPLLSFGGGDAEELDIELGGFVAAGGVQHDGDDSDAVPGFAAAEPEPASHSLSELRARFAADAADAFVRDALVSALQAGGDTKEISAVLEQAHAALAEQDRYGEAADVVQQLLDRGRDSTAVHQKRVEYAFRSGDHARLIAAYLELAEHHRAAGDASRAVTVYRRILELDPTHSVALRALAAAQPPASLRSEPAESDGYVDLAALIMEDDDEEAQPPSTRFTVPESEPTGDEDRDFADMLSTFRQKVAENIGVEDSSSNYDLGLAFKDMGLLDEAIAQFQIALRGGANPLATLEVLGECFVEKGQHSLAARVLERALRLPETPELDLIGVFYWSARCDEALGDAARAREFYERVLALDFRFRDAAVRMDAINT